MALSRTQLQALSVARYDDALLLLAHQRYSSAYYLAGYAVEFGLKACASRQVSADTIPDREFVSRVFTHNFDQLIGLAGLSHDLERQLGKQTFKLNWTIVCEWRPDVRYDTVSQTAAQLLLNAVGDPADGVMQWIRQHW